MQENIYVPGTEEERFIELMAKLLEIEEMLKQKEKPKSDTEEKIREAMG